MRYVYELFGNPDSVRCDGKIVGGVDTEENITMAYDGFEANIYVSITKLKGEKLVIEGTDGKIIVPKFHMATKAKLTGKNRRVYKEKNLLYGLELIHTAEDVKQGKRESDFCPLKSTHDVSVILDEIRKQLGVVYPCEN